jgi:GNAT superfamily N-acetyltransferase
MESIKYLNPKEAMEMGEEPQHRFELIVDGEIIGAAEVNYFSKPIPLYQVTDLYVDIKYKGKGYASKIMDQVEEWLKERRRPGVLVDAIASASSVLDLAMKSVHNTDHQKVKWVWDEKEKKGKYLNPRPN